MDSTMTAPRAVASSKAASRMGASTIKGQVLLLAASGSGSAGRQVYAHFGDQEDDCYWLPYDRGQVLLLMATGPAGACRQVSMRSKVHIDDCPRLSS